MLPKSLSLLVAVTVIFTGVALLLGNMGVIPNRLMAFWPIILVIAGLVGLTCVGPDKKSESITHTSSSKKKRK